MSGISIVHASSTILLLSIFFIFSSGLDNETFDSVLIFTGRFGLILFVVSFGASKFHAIFRAGWSRLLLKNRRYLGIASALAMFIHLFWVYAKVLALPEWWETISQYEKITGLTTLFLICVMGLTSNDISLKIMGFKNWKILHLICGYAALYAFTMEYVLLFFPDAKNQESNPVPTIAYILLMLVLSVLIARLWKNRFIRNLLTKKEYQ